MKTVAIIGASNDRNKFGNKAVRAFQQQGYADQPAPVTPGDYQGNCAATCLRDLCDGLPHEPLTLQDWVLAEKGLVNSMETDGLLKR